MKLSEEQNMENTNYTLDQALDIVLADYSEFEESGSDSVYEDEILKKNENKNIGDQSDPGEEDDIPLNTLIQEPVNPSNATSEISQDPGVNNEQETVPIYRWRKKVIKYLDVLFMEPALSPDLHDNYDGMSISSYF